MTERKRRTDQEKGIFCLETDSWFGKKDRKTVRPILELVDSFFNLEHKHHYRTVGTIEEFRHQIDAYTNPIFKTHPILYLGFHGDYVGKESLIAINKDVNLTLTELKHMLKGKLTGRVIYFGACLVMKKHGLFLNGFLKDPNAIAAMGYNDAPDWIESASFDLMCLGKIQSRALKKRSLFALDKEGNY